MGCSFRWAPLALRTGLRGWVGIRGFATPTVARYSRAYWPRCGDGTAIIPTLRETLDRQTGIYRVTALSRDDEASQLVAETCRDNCLRRVLWPQRPGTTWPLLPPEKQSAPQSPASCGQELPLLCTDACPILVGGARNVVKRRMKAEPPAALA